MTPARATIGSPLVDGIFFFGSAPLGLALALVCLASPALTMPLFIAWLWLIEGPHLLGTVQRTYLDPEARAVHGRLLWTSLLWFVPAPLALVVDLVRGEELLLPLVVGATVLWSIHHGLRQHYGFLALYRRRESVTRTIDALVLYGLGWSAFVWFTLWHPANRELLGLGDMSEPERALTGALPYFIGASLVLYGGYVLLRRRDLAGLFVLVVTTSSLATAALVGVHEPLYAQPIEPEQFFLAITIAGGTVHGLQYLGLVGLVGRRRFGASGDTRLVARLGRAPLIAWALMALVCVLYAALNVARGVVPGWTLDRSWQLAFLALYAGLFLHHYWLDQHIWRPSRDPRLREELVPSAP